MSLTRLFRLNLTFLTRLSLVIGLLLSTTAQSTDRLLSQEQCLAQLDAAVAEATHKMSDTRRVERRFKQLEQSCPHLPQLAHNLGVLAGRNGQWPEAVRHFERSLQADSRASMTHSHLKQIFEHRAAVAYARALQTSLVAIEPVLQLQSSKDQNADAKQGNQQRSDLHTISTIEYELFAWWQSLQGSVGLHEHYTSDFNKDAIRLSRQHFRGRQWHDMQREIAFTARDSVVIVSDQYHNRTLLLMRLVGSRWKIYQETRL